jgi:Family of unknown function (DUF6335)
MAKRKARNRGRKIVVAGKRRQKAHSGKRPRRRTPRRRATRKVAAKRSKPTKRVKRQPAKKPRAPRTSFPVAGKTPRLDRVRRTLEEIVPTPPSSLNMDRHGSAARTGGAGLRDSLEEHTGMTPALTGGDIDADWENAYFSGDEAPGGDNPTPDQEVVDDIGKSLGVEYHDNEELRGSEKVEDRDKHRWELDPASSEDYKDRK